MHGYEGRGGALGNIDTMIVPRQMIVPRSHLRRLVRVAQAQTVEVAAVAGRVDALLAVLRHAPASWSVCARVCLWARARTA